MSPGQPCADTTRGGTCPFADLELLDLTDEQRSDVERCAAASDHPERFVEVGADDIVERLLAPRDS